MGYCDIIHFYRNNNGNLFFKKRLENKMILDQIVENYPDEEILKADGLDLSLLGYRFEACPQGLMQKIRLSLAVGYQKKSRRAS